jgi:aspartyl-tRNA(Asn)/glutamyl-tRNA(Gln) amidotransferase subunit B
MAWEIVVGIESHTQLLTKSKMFSGASTAFGAAPNSQASAVDIALPGTLPVVNKHAIELAIRFGLAINGKINRRSVFARKNYFYPDLPKGYQISQYELPIVSGGELRIVTNAGEKVVRLTRAHLEEDAGKSIHGESLSGVVGHGVVGRMIVGKLAADEDRDLSQLSGIDLNRAGTPLLEIVSEPDLDGPEEAVAYARALHALVRWIGICDGNMQEGSFRCDANVSVRKTGEAKLGTRCEIKNLNSFRFMEQAIEFEARRQMELLEDGGIVMQETRLYDPDRGETRSMRTKEEAHDYRYFPDPDLLPLVVTDADIERIRATMPKLLEEQRKEFVTLGVPSHIAEILTSNPTGKTRVVAEANTILTQYKFSPEKHARILANTANAVVSSATVKLEDWGTSQFQMPELPNNLVQIQLRVVDGQISSRQAKEVQDAVVAGEGTVEEVIRMRGLQQISDSGAIGKIVDKVLAQNAKQVEDYRAGKDKAFNSLVGQVMKATQGKANPAQVNEILKAKLSR